MEAKKSVQKKTLRSGYTTGACAAAAAKAATILVMRNALCVMGKSSGNRSGPITHPPSRITAVEIPFPDGSRVKFKVHNSELITNDSALIGKASVIKDAGDDPDVTNGAEIYAEARFFTDSPIHPFTASPCVIKGGKGVGTVTKPGLAVPVGEAAINPIPRKMITEAVNEAVSETGEWVNRLIGKSQKKPSSLPIHPFTHSPIHRSVEITISVPDGEKLAKKTLNYRLGIAGGISILGTTGIVRPISSEAWTATITSSMDVAKAMGHKEIVLSAGRTSEKAHMKKYGLPEESYVMMGDYLEFSLLEAKKHGFKKIYLCAQWAKMLKIAMATPQTHVRHGAIDVKKATEFLRGLGTGDWSSRREFNTAREIFDFINSTLMTQNSELFSKLCATAKKYSEGIAGISAAVYLVSYEGNIIASE